MRRAFLALLVAGVTLSAAFAQEIQAISDEEVSRRLAFLENALLSAQSPSRLWWYGWIGAYSAGAAVQLGLSAAHWNDVKPDPESGDERMVRDRDFAEDMLVGGLTCALGAGGLLINSFSPAFAAKDLRRLPERTPEERKFKLLEAEKLLRRCAERESEGRGWLTHGLNLGVNAAAGLATVAIFDRPWSDGLVTFAVSEAVSLLNIFTQPRRASRDLKNYEARYLGRPEGEAKFFRDFECSLHVGPGRLTLRIRF